MPTLLRCPECNALLRIHDAHLGKAVKCPKCERVIQTLKLECLLKFLIFGQRHLDPFGSVGALAIEVKSEETG